jgi:hypothetical protein
MMLTNQSEQAVVPQLSALRWRLLVTVLLLAVMAGSGITTFRHITNAPDTQVLPTRIYNSGASPFPYSP